jgi:pyroglutamyl-peptidase
MARDHNLNSVYTLVEVFKGCLQLMLNTPAERSVKRAARPHARVPLRIGLTGFGPFPGVPFNASEHLIGELGEMRPRAIPAPLLFTAALPTDWREALARLRAFAEEVRPDVLLHFGVSARARGFVIETRAFNQASPRPDCTGALAGGRCIRSGARDVLKASLPTARLVQRLRLEGIPAELSADAGRYLCNAVLFESLALSALAPHARKVGFIHIPPLAKPSEARALENGFGWDALRRGAAVIVDTMARAQGAHG